MITAILYTSNTGATARYAQMLGDKLGLPACALERATIPKGAEIIYMGWVMASGIKGFKKASRRYAVKAVCGVCMGATGSQLPELRKQNAIPEGMALFSLQGGFDITKLRGIYRLMMNIMAKTAGKGLSNKADRTPEENDMLDMLLHGGERVNESNLAALLDWYGAQTTMQER